MRQGINSILLYWIQIWASEAQMNEFCSLVSGSRGVQAVRHVWWGFWGAEGGPRANAWEKEHGTVNLRVLSRFPRNNTLSHRPGLWTEMRGDSVFISVAAFFKGPLKACWMVSGQRIYWGEMTLNFLRRGVQSYALTCCFPPRYFFSSTWPWRILNGKINALTFIEGRWIEQI